MMEENRSTPQKFMLQMNNIYVSYDDVHALKGIDFDLYYGEIHALVGEHRAGKSSLVKILSGAVKQKSGDIIFCGEKYNNINPKSAIEKGIGLMYIFRKCLTYKCFVKHIFTPIF